MIRRVLVASGAALLLWIGFGTTPPLATRHQGEWLTVDGIRLRALRSGRGDTTLVFLHGFGESLLAWRFILDRFPSRYRVLAVDLPGFGMSDRPTGAFDDASYRGWLGKVILRATTGPVVVVGHSMGGQLAAGLALDLPDRIVALVLIAPAGDGLSTLLVDSGGLATPATQWVATTLSFVPPAHDTTWFGEPTENPGDPAAADSVAAGTARLVLREFNFAAIGEQFGKLRQPVLLIWGRQDPTIPYAIGERIAGHLPCRRLVTLPALHRPHQSLPDTVAAEMLAFLRAPVCGG